MNQVVIALDGHDGSGKTTLCRALANRLRAAYIRPFGAPFGDMIMEASKNANYDGVIQLGKEAIGSALFASAGEEVVIFDRMWVTLLTLVPLSFQERLPIMNPTAVLVCDPETTLRRLNSRSEEKEKIGWHRKYIMLYQEIAERNRCKIIDTRTNSEKDSLEELMEWASNYISQ